MCTFLRGHRGSVLCVNVALEAPLLISGSEDRTARLWDYRQKTSARAFVGFPEQVNSVCFGEDRGESGPKTVYAAAGGQVSAFDLRRPEIVLRQPSSVFAVGSDEINQIECGGRGRHLAACDDGGELKVIDLERGALFKTVRKAHSSLCTTIAFHPRKNWQLASGGMDCAVVLWDYSRPKRLATFETSAAADDAGGGGGMTVNPPMVHRVAFSGSGALLAAALGNGSAAVWSVPGARLLCAAPLHRSACCQVLFPPFASEDHILTTGEDCSLVLSSLRPRSPGSKNPELVASEAWRLRLAHKPNWLAAAEDGSVFVADSSNDISLLRPDHQASSASNTAAQTAASSAPAAQTAVVAPGVSLTSDSAATAADAGFDLAVVAPKTEQ